MSHPAVLTGISHEKLDRPELTDRSPDPALRRRARHDEALFDRYLDPHNAVDRDTIIERFLPLARQLAARYQRREEPFDDLFQVACVGLVKAVDRFDAQRGVAFSTYAVPTIIGEIKRYFRDRSWAIRVPRNLKELALRVDHSLRELTHELGRQPSVEEVARQVDVEPEDVLEAIEAYSAYRTTSLETPRTGAGDDSHETLGDTVGSVDDGFQRAEQRVLLNALMCSLTPQERKVIRLRFEHDLTQKQIGELIGVSQMQVSRMLRQAIARAHDIAEPCA